MLRMGRLMELIVDLKVVDREASRDMLRMLLDQQLTNRVVKYLRWGSYANKTSSVPGLRNDAVIMWRSRNDRVVFALCTFVQAPLPGNNSQVLVNREAIVNEAMGRIALVLWECLRRSGG